MAIGVPLYKVVRQFIEPAYQFLRRILFMQFTLFYTANCLYIIFSIFLISLQLASKFNVSLTKMLQLLASEGSALTPQTSRQGFAREPHWWTSFP